MQRKIIKLGKETFVVSLPSMWVRQHKLKKGDELKVDEEGPRLAVYPYSEAKSGKASVDISGTKPMVKRILGALYKVGYDEFEVEFDSAEELSTIKDVMSEFVGFEMLDESKSRVIVKNISHVIPDEFGNIQRKMMFIIGTMAQDSLKAMQEKSWRKLDVLANMDADVNKYADFCRRILNTIGHRVVKRVAPSYYIVEQLERIGDSYRDICRYGSEHKITPGRDLIALYGRVNEFFKAFQKCYGSFDLERIAEFAQTHYKLSGELNDMIQRVGKDELPILVLLKIAEIDTFDMNGALLAEML